MRIRRILSLVLIAVIASLLLHTGYVYSENSTQNSTQSDYANALVKLKILKGYEDGSLRLDNKVKRSEFVTLVVNMLGYNTDTDTAGIKIQFKDLKATHWAYNNVKLALKYNLVSGYPDNTIKPNNDVTYAEALAVLIRALGYDKTLEGKWPANVVNKSKELGISNNLDLIHNHKLTRGEMAVIIYNSLTISLKAD